MTPDLTFNFVTSHGWTEDDARLIAERIANERGCVLTSIEQVHPEIRVLDPLVYDGKQARWLCGADRRERVA